MIMKFKTSKKSMRVLIAVLISLLCINGALMIGTLIASATTDTSSAQVNKATNYAAKKVSEMQIAKFEAKVAKATSNTQAATALQQATTTTVTPAIKATKTTTTTAKSKTTTTTTKSTTPVAAPAPTTAPVATTPAPAPAPAPTTTTTTPSSSEISTLKNSVTPALASAFDQLQFKIVINPNSTYLGYFSTSKHSIELRSVSISTFRHEMGHFLDVLKNMPSRSTTFAGIYAKEKSLYSGSNAAYITSNAQEYFAQSYRNYLENASLLKAERPETYAFVVSQITSISSTDITRTYNQYSWSW
jgi:hypothetical protein